MSLLFCSILAKLAYMLKSGRILRLIGFSMMVLACGKVDEPSREIVFGSAFVADVRASELTTENMTSFGVFATLEEDGKSFTDVEATLDPFMDNVPVTKSGSVWSANPKHYWPLLANKKLSFFAYAPHNASSPEIDPVADWDNKNVKIDYKVHSNPLSQVDLCVAKAVLDKDSHLDMDKPVELEFSHTLTWVTFAANYVGDVPNGCFLRIEELELRNVLDENVLVHSHATGEDFFSWSDFPDGAQKDGKYLLSLNNASLGNMEIVKKDPSAASPEYTDFVSTKGYLYLLPQQVNSPEDGVRTEMKVTFAFVKNDENRTVIAQFYTTKELPESEWNVASKVKYCFTIDVNNVSLINIAPIAKKWIEDWVESGNTHTDQEIR